MHRRSSHRLRTSVIAGAAALALCVGGAGAWALDRFVIEHVEIADVEAYEAQQLGDAGSGTTGEDAEASASADDTDAVTLSDTGYESEDASIELRTIVTGSGSSQVTAYVAEVTLSDATVLRSAFAKNQFGENIIETTSTIAADHDAVFAINGDYYGFRDTGIVIRNGVVYRDEPAREGLVFSADGTVAVYDETETSAEQLLADGAWNTLSFGPALVAEGQVLEGIEDVEIDTNVGNHSIQGTQPRTAVGVIDDNHLVFVVVDGRQEGYSAGMTLGELAELMVSLGATTAYNLDGGGSSTMYFDGEVVNQPSNGGERGTSDILYIAG